MKLLLILSYVAVATAGVSRRCPGPVIGGVHYTDEVLISRLEMPMYLNFDKNTNALYYTHYFSSRDAYKLDLETKIATHIVYGVYGVYSVAVDAKTSDIFVGANEGIYKYDKDINDVKLFGAKDTEIWWLFSKDGVVYFNTFNFPTVESESYVFKLVNGEVSQLDDLKNIAVKGFILDNDGYIVYSNSTGVFRKKLGTDDVVLYGVDKFIRGFAINTSGDVYAAASDGIYLVNKQEQRLDLIFSVKGCHGVTFDAQNNIIYSDETSIHRLKHLEPEECV